MHTTARANHGARRHEYSLKRAMETGCTKVFITPWDDETLPLPQSVEELERLKDEACMNHPELSRAGIGRVALLSTYRNLIGLGWSGNSDHIPLRILE